MASRQRFTLPLILLAVGITGLMLFQYSIGGNPLTVLMDKVIVAPASYAFQKASLIRQIGLSITNFRHMAVENQELKKSVITLQAQISGLENLKEENNALRKLYGFDQGIAGSSILAGISGLSQTADGYIATVNKGRSAGVHEDDIVITPEGGLVGVVKSVSSKSARIILLYDYAFSATAKVLGGQTIGIARGNGSAGMLFDLIVQTDEIKAGDRIVTGGNDVFPAGLVIGAVQDVADNQDDVFKKVVISPVVNDIYSGNVFLISR